jgi:hypothetical protein
MPRFGVRVAAKYICYLLCIAFLFCMVGKDCHTYACRKIIVQENVLPSATGLGVALIIATKVCVWEL